MRSILDDASGRHTGHNSATTPSFALILW